MPVRFSSRWPHKRWRGTGIRIAVVLSLAAFCVPSAVRAGNEWMMRKTAADVLAMNESFLVSLGISMECGSITLEAAVRGRPESYHVLIEKLKVRPCAPAANPSRLLQEGDAYQSGIRTGRMPQEEVWGNTATNKNAGQLKERRIPALN